MGERCGCAGMVSAAMSAAAYEWPWERAAMRGDEMPDVLTLPDQMAYTAMRSIYDAYHRKSIDRDAAVAEKRKIRRAYDLAVETLAFESKLAGHRARQLRLTEAAKIACRKDPTPENALQLCSVLDGLEPCP